MKSALTIPLMAVCALVLASCASTPQQQIKSAQALGLVIGDTIKPASVEDLEPGDGYRYRLNIGDRLEVKFFRRLEYSTAVVVAPDGSISLPFLPVVMAEGKTIEELTWELETSYRQLDTNSPKPRDKKYIISVGDVLDIKFPHVSQYSGIVKVSPDGRISLPLVGAVVAEDKDPGALQIELQQLYQRYLKNPVLVVSLADTVSDYVVSNGRIRRVALPELTNLYVSLTSALELKVYIGGEVKNPQAMRYEPNLSSLQAIVAAGGITSKSELGGVIILRKGSDNKPRYIVRNLAADIAGQSTGQDSNLVVTNDIALRPFDVVIVPRTGIAKVSDGLNAYLFDLFPMLRNSSIGFNYQIGTSKVEQDTNIIDSSGN